MMMVAYVLEGNGVKRQTKIAPENSKIQQRIADFLSLNNVNAVVWLPVLVCLRSLMSKRGKQLRYVCHVAILKAVLD